MKVKKFAITAEMVNSIFLLLLTQQMTLRIAYSNYEWIWIFSTVWSALPIDGNWIAALILKTEPYCLRQYIDVTMHLASLGNRVQICCVNNFQIVRRGFFLLYAHCHITQNNLVRQWAMRIVNGKETMDPRAAFCLFMRTLPFDFALLGRKRKQTKPKTTAN